jgi:mRNA interferase MazF
MTKMPSSTVYKQGDVVLVPYPFTNQEASKQRPALVISANWVNIETQDIILVSMTTVIPTDPLRDQVELTVPDQRMCHIDRPCIIKTEKIFTIEKARVIKTLGRVSPGTLENVLHHIDDVLKNT